jgi:putative ABC transport system permease protein
MNRWTRLAMLLYPRRWRQRYGMEVETLIDDTGGGWRVVADVARQALLMRTRDHLRRLVAAPVFTITAVATLAIAIGANTVIFTIVNGLLLRPLPFPQPEALVGVWHHAPGFVSFPLNQAAFTYFTYRDEATTFEDIGLWMNSRASVIGRGEPEDLPALMVTDGTLPLLRVRPSAGRLFTEADDVPGSRETVMISHAYWLRAFQGSAAAIGQSLIVDGHAREVIGVLPDRFRLLQHAPDLVLPLRLNRAQTQIGLFRYQGVGRLKPGVSIEQATADLARLIPGMPDRFPIPTGFSREMYKAFRMAPEIHPLRDDLTGSVSGMLWIVFGAVGLLLIVACANVANLFLLRGENRRREFAVQLALGSGRARVAGQLLGEALTLSLGSGLLAIAIAHAGLRFLQRTAANQIPLIGEMTIDPTTIGFAMMLAILAGVAFCALPIIRFTRPNLPEALRENGRGSSDAHGRHRTRNALVVAQVAIALVLLVGATLMVRTFVAIRDVKPGFANGENVLTLRINIADAVSPDPVATARLHEQIVHRIADIAGVQNAALTSSITTDGANRRDPVFVEGLVGEDGRMPPVRRMKWVSPGYYQTMGDQIIAGRDFTWPDVLEHREVAIISDSLACETFGRAQAALGRRVRSNPNSPWREIVGVAGNEHDDGPTRPPTPMIYWPYLQEGHAPGRITVERALVYAVRSDRVRDAGLLRDIQQAMWAVNPTLAISRVETVEDVYRRATAQGSLTLMILLIASAVTLLLGIVGVYGVIAYVVAQRRREVGIRLALGATGQDVIRLFLGRGLAIVAIGLAIGTIAAIAGSSALSTLLFGVDRLDVSVYGLAIATLAIVAGLAIWLPARQAATTEPGIVLRN